jgi:hypothetical protein
MRSTTGGRTSLEDRERRMERAKHLFLSHLQARVGSSLVSRLGDLSPEAIFETPYSELVGWKGSSEKAARAFDQLQRGFDAGAVEDQLAARGISVLTLADVGYPGMLSNIPDPPPALSWTVSSPMWLPSRSSVHEKRRLRASRQPGRSGARWPSGACAW